MVKLHGLSSALNIRDTCASKPREGAAEIFRRFQFFELALAKQSNATTTTLQKEKSKVKYSWPIRIVMWRTRSGQGGANASTKKGHSSPDSVLAV
jgi:hypothetical protein